VEKRKPGGGAAQVELIQSPQDWDAMHPHWESLLARTPDVTALQSCEYLRTWYAHFGVIEQPYAIAVWRDGRPVACAPLQIASVWERGKYRSVLTNLSATAEAQISRILVAPDDEPAMAAIVDRILASETSWESVQLNIHHSQQRLARLLRQGLRHRHFPASTGKGFLEHRIDARAPPRDSPAQAELQLAQRGPLRFDIAPVSSLDVLDRYFDLEHYAPDDEAGRGSCASSRHISFYRALVRQHAQSLGVHIGILYAGEERAAGLIGFLWRRQFHIVHLTRPEAFAPLHAERVALARLIQWCRATDVCDSIDMSALEASAAPALATQTSQCTLLRAHSASLQGWLAHLRDRFA
jgi:hypothetical protein